MISAVTRFINRFRQTVPDDSEAAVPDGVRVYAIGDIHGRLDLLENVHARIAEDLRKNPVAHSIEIYLGDYVDRGPASNQVLEKLSSGAAVCDEQICLKGNHEDTLLRFLDGEDLLANWKKFGGLDTLISYGVKPVLPLSPEDHGNLHADLTANFPATHRAFLDALPTSKTVGGYFFVHAGVRPGVGLSEQVVGDLLWIREPFLNSNAKLEKMIVHGHTPVAEPEFHSQRINIDTGAYISGCLTCLVLESRNKRVLT
jgi:serine/threonine protein phosphatase 1